MGDNDVAPTPGTVRIHHAPAGASSASSLDYEESISGDLGDYFADDIADLGALNVGRHFVTGGLSCAPYPSDSCDFSDAFSIVIPAGLKLEAATLVLGSSSCERGFQCDWLFFGSTLPIEGFFLGNTTYADQALLVAGDAMAGTYTVGLSGSVEFGDNSQQVNRIDYVLSFDVAEVPAPAGLPLLATALAAVLALRKPKAQCPSR